MRSFLTAAIVCCLWVRGGNSLRFTPQWQSKRATVAMLRRGSSEASSTVLPKVQSALKGALLGGAVVFGCSTTALASPQSEVKPVLEKLREAENVDQLGVALDELSDVTGDGDALLPFKTKREVISSLKEKARNSAFVWDNESLAAYSRIYFKIDPFYVVELRPWLRFGPYFGGALYLTTLFVQQRLPKFFAVSYLAAAAVFVLPVLVLLNT